MQDRFKFRTWSPDLKCFTYWGWVNKGEYKNMCSCREISKDELLEKYTQQCTGLKDKYGKLIYEGDILTQPQLPHVVVCEWFKGGFWLNGFMNGAKRELHTMHNWYEIIGNIYENQELLKDGE